MDCEVFSTRSACETCNYLTSRLSTTTLLIKKWLPLIRYGLSRFTHRDQNYATFYPVLVHCSHLSCKVTRRLKKAKTLPKVRQIKIVVPKLMALFSGMIVIACSGLNRKVGAPNKPQRYQAAIR